MSHLCLFGSCSWLSCCRTAIWHSVTHLSPPLRGHYSEMHLSPNDPSTRTLQADLGTLCKGCGCRPLFAWSLFIFSFWFRCILQCLGRSWTQIHCIATLRGSSCCVRPPLCTYWNCSRCSGARTRRPLCTGLLERDLPNGSAAIAVFTGLDYARWYLKQCVDLSRRHIASRWGTWADLSIRGTFRKISESLWSNLFADCRQFDWHLAHSYIPLPRAPKCTKHWHFCSIGKHCA